jgi:hypothetical protein
LQSFVLPKKRSRNRWRNWKREKDAGLKREIEFEQKLVGLMKSYDKSLRDIIAILDPKAVARASAHPQATTPPGGQGLSEPAHRRS